MAACSTTKGAEYYPLFPPGTERVYSMSATVPGMLAGNEFQIDFAADTVIAGNRCTMVVTLTPGLPDNPRCVRVTTTGVYEFAFSEHEEFLLFPLPPKVGQQWQSRSGHATLVAFESLHTRTHRYEKCLRVRVVSPDREAGQLYYCPGVGYTKASWISSEGTVDYELKASSPRE